MAKITKKIKFLKTQFNWERKKIGNKSKSGAGIKYMVWVQNDVLVV